jgi:acylphosphatase
MTVCKHVRYSGRVQGVGFRYTAQGLAEDFGIAGYVRNLADGDVELVAEGTAEQVEAYLGALERRMAGYFDRRTMREDATAGYKDFRIRY